MLVKIVAVIPFVIFLVASIRESAHDAGPDEGPGKASCRRDRSVDRGTPAFRLHARVLSAGLNQGTVTGGSLRPPEVMIAARTDSLLRHVGLSHHVALSNRVIEVLFLAVAVLALLLLLRRGETRPVPERVLLALLIFLLCSPWLEPWYLAWFIPVIGFVTRRTLIAVAVALFAHCIGITRHTAHVRAGFPFACAAVLRRLSASCSRAAHRAPGRARPTPAT